MHLRQRDRTDDLCARLRWRSSCSSLLSRTGLPLPAATAAMVPLMQLSDTEAESSLVRGVDLTGCWGVWDQR